LAELAELEGLLRRRADGGKSLAAAETDERAALRDLATIENTLRRLVVTRGEVSAQLAAGRAELASLEGADTEDAATPGNMVAGVNRRLVGLVDRLGEANAEIAHWQVQGDGAARRAGAARARALEATMKLSDLQEPGERIAEAIRARITSLESALPWLDDDVGSLAAQQEAWARDAAALAAEYAALLAPLPDAAPEPAGLRLWPSGPAPSYVPVGGPVAASLLTAGGPVSGIERQLGDLVGSWEPAGWRPPVAGPITAPYGASTPYFPTHWAVDIGTRLYVPVTAAARGRVEFAGLATPGQPYAQHGMAVLLRHGDRLSTLYAHMDAAAFAPTVRPGEEVAKGQLLGSVGLTGYSTGPHLHFEARLDNRPVDPRLLVTLGPV
jgi:murein DD-endopeptidase MepM/ murein hydrolase activator NlpD